MNTQKDYKEGASTKAIEDKTAQLPSVLFLAAAAATAGLSIALRCVKKEHTALLVGQWTAPLLLLGIYNKIVKVEGHDSESGQ